ncbi:hypothetical protein CSB45_01820 [candidate division KSB3 bacterium]|uniref:Carrier domain-containing protein n=1 Tax=candidate division KSB3 bacterium TaxID=2044937 RepID=A0A2G6EAN9_9BACT|nr:MAG: hypothetical protein CSB45_01820 [candidate division KSB3 bacterium]
MDLTFEAFVEFLSKRFNVLATDITYDTVFTQDLGIDSLSLYSLLGDVEKEYQITLEVGDLLDINTAGKVYEYVASQFNKR